MDSSIADDILSSAIFVPDRIILVYSGDSGFGSILLDVLKKAVGQEDCPLCEITNHPLGKRSAWRSCEARFGVPVSALHANELPDEWQLSRRSLPCILAQARNRHPIRLVGRDEIVACNHDVSALERAVRTALARFGGHS